MPLLIDRLLKNLQDITDNHAILKRDTFIESGIQAIIQVARLGEHLVFSESTMRLLMESLQNYDQVVAQVMRILAEPGQEHILARVNNFINNPQVFRGVTVQFHKPVGKVAGFLTFIPSTYLRTGRDQQQLLLINSYGMPLDLLQCEPGGSWNFTDAWHSCPRCQKSQGQKGVILPCASCLDILVFWSEIMALSAIIGGQYLATMRYEEKEETSFRRVPRTHNPKKTRTHPVKHIYKVIDADEIVIPIVKKEEEEPSIAKEHQGTTWLDGTEVYEEIQTRPFMRTYRHPRYVNVRGQTQMFPNGIRRLQPKKAAMIGKTITKVIASKHEQESQEMKK